MNQTARCDRVGTATQGRRGAIRSAPAQRPHGAVAIVAGLMLAATIPAFAQTSPSVPVRVGGDWEFPACSKRGTINGSQVSGDSVPVNSTPTPSRRPIGRLPVGSEVYMCDENGTFVGVVYGDGDCGLDEPIERRAAYRGSCSSGWVHNRSIDPSNGGAV